MALTRQTMTDEQRKSVAIEYLKAYDNGGVTSTGGSILDLFASLRDRPRPIDLYIDYFGGAPLSARRPEKD